jgi:hypothetical protein
MSNNRAIKREHGQQLTVANLGHLLHLSRATSRRRCKCYIRDHGGQGNAAEVDAALGMIAEHPERAEIERVADDWAAKAKATADAAEAAARAERAREEAGLWAAVARRDGELVAKLIGDICDSACLDDPREVAIMNYGRPTAEQAGALIEWEGIGDDETLLRDAVRAAWERAWEQSAWANLEAAIIEDGPYTVGEFARDSLVCTRQWGFADRETAEAYLAMAGYDPTCAFTARVGRVDAE